MKPLVFVAAHELARKIREREISSLEVVEAHLQQIQDYNPKLNAICLLDEAGARARAQAADEAIAQGQLWGPLHGVPITIKELFEIKGVRTTAGFKALANYIPRQDAPTVTQLRQAGAVILGKTNSPVAGGDYQTFNSLFGRTNNPWDLSRTSGGSSGGSAAAVAMGLSALDLCTDYGGSIRQPAHFCGLYGIKPSDRLVPTVGHLPPTPGNAESIRYMLTVGAIARSLPDLELALSIIAKPDVRQPDISPVGLSPSSPKPLAQLNLAWSDGWDPLLPLNEIRRTIQSAVQLMEGAGTPMTRWSPSFDWSRLFKTYYRLAAYSLRYAQTPTLKALWNLVQWLWREWSQSEPALRKLSSLRTIPALLNPSLGEYFEALTERDRWSQHMEQSMADYDALLCPVAMTTAFEHCPSGSAIKIDGRNVPYTVAAGAYTIPFNLMGNPVVVIPIGQSQQGLPIGIQIVGKRWRDGELLAIAKSVNSVIGRFTSPTDRST